LSIGLPVGFDDVNGIEKDAIAFPSRESAAFLSSFLKGRQGKSPMTHPLVGWPFLGSRQSRKVRSELFDVIGRMRLRPLHAPCMGSARKKGLSVLGSPQGLAL
jgi:hypothetical protein